MKLQKNTLIALYSALEFAAQPQSKLPAARIAFKYRVSAHHVAKVLRKLRRAGLLQAARGAGGGYRFAGNPKRVTLMDIVEVFEAIGARAPRAARGEAERALAAVLAEIDQIAIATFRSITLDTMLKLVAQARRGPRGRAA